MNLRTLAITAAGLVLAATLAIAIQDAETFPARKPAGEPDRVKVRHILISFKGSALTDPAITRTRAEAEKLAADVLARVRKGEDFGALAKAHSDDHLRSIYKLANFGVEAIASPPSQKETSRSKMVRNFGDVSFKLAVGETGLAVYDPVRSKYGWHIILRLE